MTTLNFEKNPREGGNGSTRGQGVRTISNSKTNDIGVPQSERSQQGVENNQNRSSSTASSRRRRRKKK